MPKQDVPKRIKKLRAAMGLTQEQFAAAVGVTYATVNRWENGNANPATLAPGDRGNGTRGRGGEEKARWEEGLRDGG